MWRSCFSACLPFLLFLCSCAQFQGLEKRVYAKGYYVSFSHKSKVPASSSVPGTASSIVPVENPLPVNIPASVLHGTDSGKVHHRDTVMLLLHKNVGYHIDLGEKNHYKILPYLSNDQLLYTTFYKVGDSTVMLRVNKRNKITYDTVITMAEYLACWEKVSGKKIEKDSSIHVPEGCSLLTLSPFTGSYISLSEKTGFDLFPSISRGEYDHGFLYADPSGVIVLHYTTQKGMVKEKKISRETYERCRKRAGIMSADPQYYTRRQVGTAAGFFFAVIALVITAIIVFIVAILALFGLL